jgi:hypothetical protein
MKKEFKTAKEAIAYAKENHLVAVTVGGKKLAVSSNEEKRLLDSGAEFAFLNTVEKDGKQIVVSIPIDGKEPEMDGRTHYKKMSVDELMGDGIHKSVNKQFGNPALPYSPSGGEQKVWVIYRDFDKIAAISPEFSEEDVRKIAEILNAGAREFERARGLSFEE